MVEGWFVIAYLFAGALWAGLNHQSTYKCYVCYTQEGGSDAEGVLLSLVRGAFWPINMLFKFGMWYRGKFL